MTIKISEREKRALEVLADAGGPDGFGFLSFATVARRSGLDPKVIRRTVRALARKGLAEFGSGLCTEDGEFAGSGYCASQLGLEMGQLPADRIEKTATPTQSIAPHQGASDELDDSKGAM